MADSCMRNASGHNYRNSSFIVDLAMEQTSRSTKRIFRLHIVYNSKTFFRLCFRSLHVQLGDVS